MLATKPSPTWVYWSAKGGAGCSSVAAAAALLSVRDLSPDDPGVLLVDLGGDLVDLLGVRSQLPEPLLGLAHWLTASNPPPDALERLEIQVAPMVWLLPWGEPGSSEADGAVDRTEALARLLASDSRPVVVDAGVRHSSTNQFGPVGPKEALSEHLHGLATRSILVTRLCYLALRAAQKLAEPDEVVVVVEPGRALRVSDVQAVFASSSASCIRWDPSVARSIDAGLLASRLPRPLARLPHPGSDQRVEQ